LLASIVILVDKNESTIKDDKCSCEIAHDYTIDGRIEFTCGATDDAHNARRDIDRANTNTYDIQWVTDNAKAINTRCIVCHQ
jgi:hypothetical protein